MSQQKVVTQIKPRLQVPELTVPTLNGSPWRLADQNPESLTLILFYRGYHCPMCQSQLRDYDRHVADYKALGVDIIAISSNSEDLARKAYDEWDLSNLKIGYGLSLEKAREWGLFISNAIKDTEPEQFSEPGLFLIKPDATLYASVVQTMPFVRIGAKQLIGNLEGVIEYQYPARGEA